MSTASHWSRWLLISLAINTIIILSVQLIPIAVPSFGGEHLLSIMLMQPATAAEPTVTLPVLMPPQQPLPIALRPGVPRHSQEKNGPPSVTPGPGAGKASPMRIVDSKNGTKPVPTSNNDEPSDDPTVNNPGPPGPSYPASPIEGGRTAAVYPKNAQTPPDGSDPIEGTVTVHVSISEMGNVSILSVSGSDNPLLVSAARKAANQWQFKPAMKNGKPISDSAAICFRFAADGGTKVKGEAL
jgi:periplasmic protein TonB